MAKRDIMGVVDFPYLEAYAAGDAALVEEVLRLFEHQAELWIRLLDPAGDAETWKDGAHTLKGASAGIGANALAQICNEAERMAHETEPYKAALLGRLRSALDFVKSDIAAYRHHLALRSLKT